MPSIRHFIDENTQIERQRAIEEYVIDINNKLFELCAFMKLDIQDIKKIDKKNYQQNPFNDEQKKAIIQAIKMQEEIDKDFEVVPSVPSSTNKKAEDINKSEQLIRAQAIKAAGISPRDLDSANISYNDYIASNLENNVSKIRKETYDKILSKNLQIEADRNSQAERMKLLAGFNKLSNGVGMAPPKTDWERVDLPKDEKDKILESIRANPKSNVFSKEFNWNPKDFLGAFSYLEETENYNGPFIISVVDDKLELEKYSKIPKLSDGIQKICVGKYLLLSVYDITASSKDAKHIYIGLKYIGMAGRLEFDSIGSTAGDIKNSQKKIAMEYMDAMDIIYDENHIDLKLS